MRATLSDRQFACPYEPSAQERSTCGTGRCTTQRIASRGAVGGCKKREPRAGVEHLFLQIQGSIRTFILEGFQEIRGRTRRVIRERLTSLSPQSRCATGPSALNAIRPDRPSRGPRRRRRGPWWSSQALVDTPSPRFLSRFELLWAHGRASPARSDPRLASLHHRDLPLQKVRTSRATRCWLQVSPASLRSRKTRGAP